MAQRRLEKISELLRETIADLLLVKSKDPRLKSVNVTGVKVTADLKKAVVHYSVFGGEEDKAEAAKALAKASGFVRAVVGESLKLKYAPEIKFEFDRNLEYAQHMNELLGRLVPDGASKGDAEEGRDDD
ncbi:30S ribosome-binding factor RbfA [Deltaproteobacteria bacterium OttesenSCG-928-K17]|nr:30S ribosome-binding factor RbfA [Deltaproteobacteria bacterium OttesenSCG-928-K17]